MCKHLAGVAPGLPGAAIRFGANVELISFGGKIAMSKSKAAEKEAFMLHKSDLEAIISQSMDDAQLGRIFRAIIEYQLNGNENAAAGNDPQVSACFSFILARFKRDEAKYQQICEERSKAAKTRWNDANDANGCNSMQKDANDADMTRDDNDMTRDDMTRGDIQQQKEIIVVEKKEDSKEGKPFKPPLLPDIDYFFGTMGRAQDARGFFDYYNARGWVFSGGDKMKTTADWKKAARAWKPQESKPQDQDSQPAGDAPPGKDFQVAGYKRKKYD